MFLATLKILPDSVCLSGVASSEYIAALVPGEFSLSSSGAQSTDANQHGKFDSSLARDWSF